jgi:beta-glucosidase-like glycosyl hydrolase
MDPTRLLFPALRWSETTGFDHETERIETTLERGVGGFILFGGPAESVRDLIARLQAAAPHPLLIGADLERGTAQQFAGCTSLPPASALGVVDDLESCYRAGYVTAKEALALGVGWVYAPVADLGGEASNPIVGTRAFGEDPRAVARQVVAWIQGCQDGGALACAKHFPGHGRTLSDSHVGLPVVEADETVLARDLIPFAAAVDAGVASVMTAHVSYPSLDPSGVPATRSARMIQGLLRDELQFDGLVVTDALVMAAAAFDQASETAVALDALDAGVDVLLYPRDPIVVSDRLRHAVAAGRLDAGRLLESVERVAAAAERVGTARGAWGETVDGLWAREVARRSLIWLRPPSDLPLEAGGGLVIVDDDAGGPFPAPSRTPLREALRGAAERVASTETAPSPWLAVFCDPRGWKGRAGLSHRAREAVADAAPTAGVVLLFGHPRLAEEIPGEAPLLCAWGGELIMQEAAADVALRLGA